MTNNLPETPPPQKVTIEHPEAGFMDVLVDGVKTERMFTEVDCEAGTAKEMFTRDKAPPEFEDVTGNFEIVWTGDCNEPRS